MQQLENKEHAHNSYFLNKRPSNNYLSRSGSNKSITTGLILLFVQTSFIVSVILNIPVVRQVLGFLCVTFLPGFAILNILKSNRITVTETLLFSVGLSIVFVAIVGLMTNEGLSFLGFSKPLSENTLMLTLNAASLLIYSIVFLVNRHGNSHFGITNQKIAQTFLFFALILMSVAGSILVNACKSNSLIIVMMIIITLFFVVASFEKFDNKLYPVALLAISAALIFQRSLISNYINGIDIHSEYYVLTATLNRFRWMPISFAGDIPLTYSTYNSMLSGTIFAATCSILLGMKQTWILKIVFPLIYSLVPLGLYQLHRTKAGKYVAFVATFFFMANFDVFLQPTANAKQMIADLFYVLLFISLMRKNMEASTKFLCTFLFSIGLITSHYGTSYIFLIIVTGAWLYGYIRKRYGNITLKFLLLFSTIAFFWYIYTSTGGPFDKIINITNNIYYNFLEDFSSIGSRGIEVEGAITGMAPSILHDISRGLFFVTLFFIFLGFLASILNRGGRNLDQEYKRILHLGMFILFIVIVVPNIAPSLRMERFYNMLIILIAPLFMLGVKLFVNNVLGSNRKLVQAAFIVAVLVPFFLFQSGLIYEVANDPFPTTPSLSMYRRGNNPYTRAGFVHESDVYSATWLSNHINVTPGQMYSDLVSEWIVLRSYGMIPYVYITILSNATTILPDSYVYVRMYNASVIMSGGTRTNITNLGSLSNVLYSNGNCSILLTLKNSTSVNQLFGSNGG